MKKIALVVLLLSSLCFAANKPDPATFTLNLHITTSTRRVGEERLETFLDGKKLVLSHFSTCEYVHIHACAILPPGYYKARIEGQETTKTGRIATSYDILLADGTADRYEVVSLSE